MVGLSRPGQAAPSLRGRREFNAGRGQTNYTDNKFNALLAHDGGVYVSSWNALWLYLDDTWQRVEGPSGVDGRAPNQLFSTDDGLVADFLNGAFRLADGKWEQLWTPAGFRLWDVDRFGGTVSGNAGGGLQLRRFDQSPCVAQTEPLAGLSISDVALDDSGRAWVGTDYGLFVFDATGRLAARWEPGQLAGLTGYVDSIAIVGAGPSSLPARGDAQTWTVIGRAEVSKTGRALAGAEVTLCNRGAPDEECSGGVFLRRATTGPDGTFRLSDVPVGDFRLLFAPPPQTDGCDGIFHPERWRVQTARACSGPQCDLGTFQACPPFEMPPPHWRALSHRGGSDTSHLRRSAL